LGEIAGEVGMTGLVETSVAAEIVDLTEKLKVVTD